MPSDVREPPTAGWQCSGCGFGVGRPVWNLGAKCIDCGRSRDYSIGYEAALMAKERKR